MILTIIILSVLLCISVWLNCKMLQYMPTNTNKDPYVPKGRRGILYREFTNTKNGVQSDHGVQMEIEEIEKTATKSKIKILNSVLTTTTIKDSEITDLWDNSWIESKDIEWIDDLTSKERENKLNNILN